MEDIEKSKKEVASTLEKLRIIDEKYADCSRMLEQLTEMRKHGIRYCAQLVKGFSDKGREETLVDIKKELYDEIIANTFLFSDLAKLDKRSLQKILFAVNPKQIALAVKLIDGTQVKKFIYSNVSKNNIALIRQEEEALGDSVVRADAAKAQRDIVDLAIKMHNDGDIVFPEGI